MDKELIIKIANYVTINQDLPRAIENYDEVSLKNAIEELTNNKIITTSMANSFSKLNNGKAIRTSQKAYIFNHSECKKVYGISVV
jgi:hypothetical protein